MIVLVVMHLRNRPEGFRSLVLAPRNEREEPGVFENVFWGKSALFT